MTVRVYLALGSNIGDRPQNLRRAVQLLDATETISVQKLSAVYETEPVGYEEQPAFLNMVIAADTELTPSQLLEAVLAVETQMGRVRTIRWGPRLIDIDILLYGRETVNSPNLQIPHPRMPERGFVLIPLRDVWGEEDVLPFFDKPLQEYIETLALDKEVHVWGTLDWGTGSGPSAS
ncbi:2-amino-4-hydroxy-6-hydroxymethyldihydropteridine diphosphokinase [Brevibacillus humidisoli]|uniref:2-amino-4-hydroxy-6- hydroxymethyldihydropteridine diphosphokinase n=1 Tax=Brevibacillus humidisoli TaxID=2895522 RepID=UPI001E300BC6|nr:2-amino-4-hydroxy-6-hydroxymethyldihydropteridine diphosphokinase [Brevibacillus humidisoli]UFJ40613.1 2-amino-4-hydroxy-6-hydroxymethyldihydropteridine diphosphokinase [Brevibacillus humidisoli]